MAPSPNEAAGSVADANDVPASSPKPTAPPSLPPIAKLVSDPRTALSAKGRQRRRSDESCQTATKSCDSRQVDLSYFSL